MEEKSRGRPAGEDPRPLARAPQSLGSQYVDGDSLAASAAMRDAKTKNIDVSEK